MSGEERGHESRADSREAAEGKTDRDRTDQSHLVCCCDCEREDGGGRIENINLIKQEGLYEQHPAGRRIRRATQVRHKACRNTHGKVR